MKNQALQSIAILLLILAILIVGCTVENQTGLPPAKIVYQIRGYKNPQIGFVNSDGSDQIIIETQRYLQKPVKMNDVLFGLRWTGGSDGNIASWTGGKIRYCKDLGMVNMIGNVLPANPPSLAVITNHWDQILLYNTEKCEIEEVFLDIRSDPNDKELMGGMLSPDGKYLLYSEGKKDTRGVYIYEMKVLDLDNNKIADIGNGVNPSWSPDGEWIAYLMIDGIYVRSIDGSEDFKLVQSDFSRYRFDDVFYQDEFDLQLPFPRWSPDGEWIVYHTCDPDPEEQSYDICRIYKAELSTGKIETIVDDGMYPYWRQE